MKFSGKFIIEKPPKITEIFSKIEGINFLFVTQHYFRKYYKKCYFFPILEIVNFKNT